MAKGEIVGRVEAAVQHGWAMVADAVRSGITALGNENKDRDAALSPNITRADLSSSEREYWPETSGYVYTALWTLPLAAVRPGWTVSLGDERDVTREFDEAIDVPRRLMMADYLARRDGGSVSLLVTSDRDATDQPLRSPSEVRAVQIMERDEANALTYVRDVTSIRFRDVETWMLSPLDAPGLVAHWTRAIYMPAAMTSLKRRRERNGYGTSMQALYRDALLRRESFDQSAGGLAQAMSVDVVKLHDFDLKIAGGKANDVASKANQFSRSKSSVGTGVLDAQDQYERHALSAQGFDQLDSTNRRAIAAVERIPQSILFGDPPSGLNTDNESARRTFAQRVEEHRALWLEPWLRTLYAAQYGAEEAAQMVIEWGPVYPPDPVELAQIRLLHAQADDMRIAGGVLGADEVRAERFGSEEYGDEIHVEEGGDLPSLVSPEPEGEPDPVADAADLRAKGWTYRQIGDALGVSISTARRRVLDAETYTLPESARNNARQVLKWREEHPDEIEGMTEVGWRRARQLANNETVSLETVQAMSAFNRHRDNAEVSAEFTDEPWRDAGYVAWLGRGGTTGIDWAREITGATDDE